MQNIAIFRGYESASRLIWFASFHDDLHSSAEPKSLVFSFKLDMYNLHSRQTICFLKDSRGSSRTQHVLGDPHWRSVYSTISCSVMAYGFWLFCANARIGVYWCKGPSLNLGMGYKPAQPVETTDYCGVYEFVQDSKSEGPNPLVQNASLISEPTTGDAAEVCRVLGDGCGCSGSFPRRIAAS